jgi:hypothetical protein
MRFIFLLLSLFPACSLFRFQRPDIVPVQVNTHLSREHYVSPDEIAKLEMGMTEEEVYKITSEDVWKRITFDPILPKCIVPGEYIPVDKFISFRGAGTVEVTKTSEYIQYKPKGSWSQIRLYFYKNRLIHFSVYAYLIGGEFGNTIIPTTPDQLHPEAFDIVESDNKYFEVFIFKIREKKRISFVNKEVKIYWEAPDFEEKLRKSGYYDYKAKLDKDFEEKKGYWTPKK